MVNGISILLFFTINATIVVIRLKQKEKKYVSIGRQNMAGGKAGV